MERGLCVGIDIAKRHWDVAVAGRAGVRRFKSDAAGLEETLSYLQSLGAVLVCLEATGGYERSLRMALHARGVAVCVVNPRQVRDFARCYRPTGQDRSAGRRGDRPLRSDDGSGACRTA